MATLTLLPSWKARPAHPACTQVLDTPVLGCQGPSARSWQPLSQGSAQWGKVTPTLES